MGEELSTGLNGYDLVQGMRWVLSAWARGGFSTRLRYLVQDSEILYRTSGLRERDFVRESEI